MIYKFDFSRVNNWRVNTPTNTYETLDFQNIDVTTGSGTIPYLQAAKPVGGDFKAEGFGGIKPLNGDQQ